MLGAPSCGASLDGPPASPANGEYQILLSEANAKLGLLQQFNRWTMKLDMVRKLYFAYGSNLCMKRFRLRVPSAFFRCLAALEDFKLVFQKRSKDGSGKATIIPAHDSKVEGAIFEYNEKDHKKLQQAERGYSEHTIAVATAEGNVQALTFICDAELVSTLRPYSWYVDLIRTGGKELGLQEEYLKRFEEVETSTDPDHANEAMEREFLV